MRAAIRGVDRRRCRRDRAGVMGEPPRARPPARRPGLRDGLFALVGRYSRLRDTRPHAGDVHGRDRDEVPCQWAMAPPPVSPLAFWPGLHPLLTSGVGSQVVSIAFAWPNNDATPRSMELTFGGRPITVTQAGNPCPITLSPAYPATVVMPANGGLGTFTISTNRPSCFYTASALGRASPLSPGRPGACFRPRRHLPLEPNRSGRVIQFGVSASSTGGFGPTVRSVGITQNGAPVTTDAPAPGFAFAVHRPTAGPTNISASEPIRITNAEDATATWSASVSEP